MARAKVVTKWLGELTIIVLGVLVALAAEDWRQERLDRSAALSFLATLREDLQRDTANLHQGLRNGERVLACANTLLIHLGDSLWTPEQATGEPVVPLVGTLRCVANVPVFFPSDGTYREMSATGAMRSLPDAELRRDIVDYYEFHAPRQLSREERRVQPAAAAFENALFAAGLTAFDPLQADHGIIDRLAGDATVLATIRQIAAGARIVPPRDYPALIDRATALISAIDDGR